MREVDNRVEVPASWNKRLNREPDVEGFSQPGHLAEGGLSDYCFTYLTTLRAYRRRGLPNSVDRLNPVARRSYRLQSSATKPRRKRPWGFTLDHSATLEASRQVLVVWWLVWRRRR